MHAGLEQQTRWPPRRESRGGYTLLEMLLTMGLVVAVAGFAWPALRGPLGNQRLREGAKAVRIELARTRLKAMESAQAYEFRYLAGSGRYFVRPVPGMSTTPPNSGSEPEWDFNRTALDAAAANSESVVEGEMFTLPEGVVFTTQDDLPSLAEPADPVEGLDNSGQFDAQIEPGPSISLDGERWSAPIRFRPDGTTTPARIVLKNDRGNWLELDLRGLTGVITISPLHSTDEGA